jgi:hypothetical protein
MQQIVIDRAKAPRFQQQAIVTTADRLAPPLVVDPPDFLNRDDRQATSISPEGDRFTVRIELDAQALREVEGT